MQIDVSTEIEIGRPREVVSKYAADPDNAREWYRNIKSVEWKSPKPLQVGSRIAFVARFLGRSIAYTYEVKEFSPENRFVMATTEGPFMMETTYEWDDAGEGHTRMTLRNRGVPTGFGKIAAPMMSAAIKRANKSDLELLKQILENQTNGDGRD